MHAAVFFYVFEQLVTTVNFSRPDICQTTHLDIHIRFDFNTHAKIYYVYAYFICLCDILGRGINYRCQFKC